MKKIIKLNNQGFCYGVTHAIEIAIAASKNESYPKPIYLLGDIVHNKHISLLLDKLGIITIKGNNRLQMLDQVEDYKTVIFSAHGVSDKVKEKAKRKHLVIVDAICPYVEKTVNLMKDELNKGNEIIYIGKENHPETEAALELSEHVHLIQSKADFDNSFIDKKIKIANQTTMSKYDIELLCNEILSYYPKAQVLDMVCKVTEKRQDELKTTIDKLNNSLIIIIGDKNSNNSTKLYELAKRSINNYSVFIESINDLDLSIVRKYDTIVIASGTSTPIVLINEVEETIKNIDNIKEDYIKSNIQLDDYLK